MRYNLLWFIVGHILKILADRNLANVPDIKQFGCQNRHFLKLGERCRRNFLLTAMVEVDAQLRWSNLFGELS